MSLEIQNRTIDNREVDNREVELKLSLPPTALAALRQHPLFVAAVLLSSEAVESTYYDTPDFALRACGIALRLRRAGDIWRQTVKCAATSTGGLAARPEWEQPWGGHFDFCGVTDARVRTFLVGNAARLTPVFNTRFHRETRCHSVDGARIRLMLDTGEILAGERSELLCELELELDAGAPVDLLRLAEQLAVALPLFPDDRSKAARGYRAVVARPRGAGRCGREPRPLAASRPRWPRSASWRNPACASGRPMSGVRCAIPLPTPIPTPIPNTSISCGWACAACARCCACSRRCCRRLLPPSGGGAWATTRAPWAAPAISMCCATSCWRRCRPRAARTTRARALSAALETARGAARMEALRHLDLAAQGRLLLAFMVALHSLPDADARRRGALAARLARAAPGPRAVPGRQALGGGAAGRSGAAAPAAHRLQAVALRPRLCAPLLRRRR